MNKKLIAIILAAVVLLSAIGVGIYFHFKNDEVTNDISYASVEISAENILFAQNSNKPNIELLLDENMLFEAFGSENSNIQFRKADRIRVHFSDGKKFEIEPTSENVKVSEKDGLNSIKIYTDEKDLFEEVNDILRFDTSCSVKIFFDEGTFELNDKPSRAVTFTLKFDSKIVSDAHDAYMQAVYENHVLKLSMTDAQGKEILFTTSGNTSEKLIVYTDEEDKHYFNNNLVITDLFKTALMNPSEEFADGKVISVYVPTGFFADTDGNRIKVIGLRNSDKNIRLATIDEVTEATTEAQQADTEVTGAFLSESDGVSVEPTFGEEIPLATGELLRTLTDLEVLVPTDADLEEAEITASIITSTDAYDIPASSIACLYTEAMAGYVIDVSIEDTESCEIGGIILNGILFEENKTYDLKLTATDNNGNILAEISAMIAY